MPQSKNQEIHIKTNIFDLHRDILNDYKLYIDSFINIADEKILKTVKNEFDSGNLYPEPLIQFNPSFESGGKVQDLVDDGILAKDFNNIFYDETEDSWTIYKHQKEAIIKGNDGKGFVVTSGTGSGKSLTYISTIFNYLFKNPGTPGIKAIIVYPLNALINSQEAALKGFEDNYQKRTGRSLPFTFAKYTGQEKQDERDKAASNPPDILLTNYMMLELLMVRKADENLRKAFLDSIQFLVFDELHVYKGRQGADVSLLNRRIKAGATNKNIICIGTSATMATGTVDEQKKEVAKVATRFFDTTFYADNVIVESLTYSTNETIPSKHELQLALGADIVNKSKHVILENPIAIWLERTIAVRNEGGHKRRNEPKSLKTIAAELSEETGIAETDCEKKIVEVLIWAEWLNVAGAKEKKKDTILPFKLHQFISQTGYVYVTIESAENRFITLQPNPFIKQLGSDNELPVFQTVFSRLTGVEFICVRKDFTILSSPKLIFRDFDDNQNPKNDDDLKTNNGTQKQKVKNRVQDDYKDGYVLLEKNHQFNIHDFVDLLPAAWINKKGEIDSSKDFLTPKEIYVLKDGAFSETQNGGEKAWFIPAPLIYDPTCGLIYLEPKLSEKSKLISLGNEGRSTSTTIITLQTLLALYKQGKEIKEQKLLSFTDNRQDASLQAGHFNDFIQVVHLRSAIEKVLRNSDGPLKISDLIFDVQEALKLPETEYAVNPAPNPNRPNEDNLEALRNYISYRIIQDLKRGWRYILPNLEQTALLDITYKNLEKDCADDSLWANIDLLQHWSVEKRKEFILQILNYFRNMYAVDYEMLRYEKRLKVESELNEQLNKEKLWSLDKGEKLEAPNFLSLQGADKATREIFIQSIGPSSRLARYVKHEFRIAGFTAPNSADYNSFMTSLLDALVEAQYLKKVNIKAEKGDKDAYQLILSKVLWKTGDKNNVAVDKTSHVLLHNQGLEIKPHFYFQNLYQQDFSSLPKSYIAAEHTGQIKNEDKIEREEKFNKAEELSALYCSPTMELGIDISSLNIVHMRNVPPSPANYAQRSGRAGRSGQSALVFTYSSKVSPHDKHYFANPVKMVAGIVQAPRIDLTNEELLRCHINATVLSFLNAEEFKPSLVDLIDFSCGTYKLKKDLKAKYQDVIDSRFSEIRNTVLNVIEGITELRETKWYTTNWLENEIKNVPAKLEQSLLRWKKMYLDAKRQMDEAHEIKTSPVIKDAETKKQANRSYFLAEERLNLLKNDKNKNSTLSEFYTFRYLASEGFLPGYNFTRLPIRVFLGGKDKNESISRPRFIGLKEFGPNNLIYHNGGKYKVKRITPNDVSLDLMTIKISKDTNYAFLGDEAKGKNQDPITGTQFTASNIDIHSNLLELEEAQSESDERISCMEEVRASEGYVTEMYFNSADGLADATKIKLTIDSDELMKLFYAPSAKLILLNKKWKRGTTDGFDIGAKTGFFKTKKQLLRPSVEDPPANIMLYTYDTSDVLYVQPVKSLGLTEDGVTTLQFALLKAIEQQYNIESVEIDARLMGGNEHKNIMLYESAEGSIGVLKDIARNPAKLRDIFLKAYEICGYDFATKQDKFPERPKASYDDLLSYYNQIDHSKIDRRSIIKALDLLIMSNPDDTVGGTYENKYEELKKGLHHGSPGEKQLLDHLYENGYRLPDFTNYNMEKYYIQPDFVYEKENALIFVDGGIHRNKILKIDDDKKRKILEMDGFDVLVWDYISEQVASFVARRQDVFRKVR
jgi:superfamily II DNA/RNA helicase/very-short-patch-repair endonuclease